MCYFYCYYKPVNSHLVIISEHLITNCNSERTQKHSKTCTSNHWESLYNPTILLLVKYITVCHLPVFRIQVTLAANSHIILVGTNNAVATNKLTV